MAWKAPTKHLRNKDLVNEKVFYRKLSQKCNFADDDAVAAWYTGLVKLVSQELRDNKFVRLPHLGDMALIEQKARPAWAGRLHVMIPPMEVLKFYPKERMRRYFNKRHAQSL